MGLFNAPNLMSASRLVLAAIFPFTDSRWGLALVILAALTDCLDGLLARALNLKTIAGQVLDPLGDKVFAFAVLLTLCFTARAEWWQLAPILSRDLVAAVAGASLAFRQRWESGALLMAAPLGKAATVLEYLWFASILSTLGQDYRLPLFWLTAVTCMLAAGQYAIRFAAALRDDARTHSSGDQ
jgi:phosphatidylglycerophosphate synthase